MRKLVARALLLAAAAAVTGCASGYPSTEERIEKVDKTIQSEQLQGQRSEARDKRFSEWTGVKPAPEQPPKK